jgi:hypothetical protein
LGLGPWYYDNGAIEITKADERHDRVDVVSRGFLGLTVACARCHDHKYDPIPTKDYYSLAGVFLNTAYHEYPLAPQSEVDEFKALEKKIEQKQKLLNEFLETESRQLGETLALHTSKYVQAAWKVTGEPKDPIGRVVDQEKLDFELFDRWVAFLAKPPRFYPYLKDWQEMIKRGGTANEAKKLADEFQALLLDVMFAKKEIDEENEIIRAKALPGTKKKKPRTGADATVDRRVSTGSCRWVRAFDRTGLCQAGGAEFSRMGAGTTAERGSPSPRRGPAQRHQVTQGQPAAEVRIRARRCGHGQDCPNAGQRARQPNASG